jgi:uncharacterized membrane protein YvlD (DUF360 family)
MSSASVRTAPERRLRFLRYGLFVVVVVAFAFAAATSLFSMAGNIGAALLQGVLWGVIAGVVSVVVYLIYKKVVLKM